MQLRPYQLDAIAKCSAAYRAGHKGVLLVVPTGGGKTVIYSEIARSLVAAGAPVLVVEPAVELVEQTRDKLARLGVSRVGIVAAGWGGGYNPDPGAMVQVATVQTLRSRPHALLRRPRFIVFDEAHLAAADSYRLIRERYPEANRLGVTATPWRLDGEPFLDLATELVIGPTVPELRQLGALTPFRTRSIPLTAFARSSRRPAAEFNLREMAEAYNRQQLVGDVVTHYTEHAAGRSGLVFAASVEHSRQLCARFREAGIDAEHLDGTTHKLERAAMLARLESGSTQLICNYGVLTAGFDCPRVAAVSIARATASKSLWIQMAGRGLRPFGGKADCVILDHGGNALRHGNLAHPHLRCRTCAELPAPCAACVRRVLDGRRQAETDDEAEAMDLGKACPTCLTVIDTAAAVCPFCAHDFATPARGGRGEVRGVDGQLVELDADAAPLELTPPESAEERERRRVEHAGRFLRRRAVENARSWAERMAVAR